MYRGILHVHSTHSYDGKVSLPELKALLQKEGLSFACMTEHTDTLTPEAAELFVAECRTLSDASFVFVPGFEVPYGDAHVLHIGATRFQTAVAHTALELQAWREVASLVLLAHPVRNRFVVDEVLLGVIDGIEVWNQQYEGKRAPRTRSLALLKKLRHQKQLWGSGGVDFHRREHLGTPYTRMDITELTETAILAALKAGAYTFGSTTCSIGATEVWSVGFGARVQSAVSIFIIGSGKLVNAALARLGISLPKRLVRSIRGRV